MSTMKNKLTKQLDKINQSLVSNRAKLTKAAGDPQRKARLNARIERAERKRMLLEATLKAAGGDKSALKGLKASLPHATPTKKHTIKKPKIVTKAETQRVGVKAESIQDLHADLDKLKSDADKLQSQIGVTKKQQDELKVTIKEIEATRDKLRGKRQKIKDIKDTAAKIEKIKEELTEKKPMYRVGGTGPRFKETTQKLQNMADEFFSKSGLPSEDKVNKYLKEHPGARNKPAPWKAKNTTEALNRLGYAATQMIIGAAVEEGLPFSLTAVPPISRGADRGYRVLGGLLTPSPADLLAGQLLAKIAKSKAWRKITGKYGEVKITELEKEATRQIEKLKVPGQQYSTAEIRKGVNKIYRSIEEIAEFYADHPELATPERSSAGAAQVPKLVVEFEDYLDDLGWGMDYYYEFMRSRAPDLPAGALVNVLAGSMDRGTSIDETAESLTEFYRDAPDSAMISRDKSKIIPEAKAGEKEEAKTGGAVGPEPVTVKELTKQKTKTGEAQATVQVPAVIEEVSPSESPEPLPPTPPLKLSLAEKKKRREMNLLQLGSKQTWAINYGYPRGPGKSVSVEARSMVDAMSKAQRSTPPSRYLPNVVDIKLMKGK